MSSSAAAERLDGALAVAKSLVSTGTSLRGGTRRPLAPPPMSSRPPRNCTASATISTAWRFSPCWVWNSRHSRRPSIATGRPLDRKRAQFSPWAPQTVTSKKFGLSSHSPVWLFLRRGLAAVGREQTGRAGPGGRSAGYRARVGVTGQVAGQHDAVEVGGSHGGLLSRGLQAQGGESRSGVGGDQGWV